MRFKGTVLVEKPSFLIRKPTGSLHLMIDLRIWTKSMEPRSLIRLMFLFRNLVNEKVSWCKLDVKMSKKEFYTMKCHKKTATFLSYCGTNHQGDLFGVYLVPKICHYLSLLVSHWLPSLCVELAKLCSFPISVRACFDFERIRDRVFPQSSVFQSKLSIRSFEIIIF